MTHEYRMTRYNVTVQKQTVQNKTESNCSIYLLKELGKERKTKNIQR